MRDDGVDYYGDVDSGNVVLGYGFAASAFGVAAARANGRFDHAAPLAGLAGHRRRWLSLASATCWWVP